MLAGKVAIVTGAASGIGEATAIEFAENGANLTLVDRNREGLEKCAQACFAANGKHAQTITADLGVEEETRTVVPKAIEYWGHLDVLVNNAGVVIPNSINNNNFIPLLKKIMQTNLFAAAILTNDAAPHLVESKGNIVNVSSIAALAPKTEGIGYCISKTALDQLTKCTALELSPKGVRVNSVNPGPVRTKIAIATGFTPEQSNAYFEEFGKKMPLKRVAESYEIASLITFLASEKAKCITGSIIVSDCGAMVSDNVLPNRHQLN